LKELERYFGVELIRRGHRPLVLTDAGQRLYRIVGHALGALEELRRTCAQDPVELVIGAGESLIQWLLLPRMGTLTRDHPRLSVVLQNLRTEEILKELVEGSVDFGVISRLGPKPDLASLPLGRLDYGLFVPAGFWSTRRRCKPTSRVLDHLPMALLRGSASIRQALEQEAERHKLRLDIRLRSTSYPQLAQALQSMRVAVIMPTLAAQSLPAGSFEIVRLPFLTAHSRRLSLAWNRKLAQIRPALERYSKVLALTFRDPPT
jgi:DNA-binding transcriptional LysR family regulator